MILLIHKDGSRVLKVLKDGKPISYNGDLCSTFWELAEHFPKELLIWVEEQQWNKFNIDAFSTAFIHNRVMASYAVRTTFLPDSIGYVDQFPFVNVNKKVKYPTWRMSWDVGGINTEIISCFKELRKVKDFGYLLNSIAKLGQQNGLFCYSDPSLITNVNNNVPNATSSKKHLFSFVFQNYKTLRSFFFFLCILKYEKKIFLLPLFKSFRKKKFFKKLIILPDITNQGESGEMCKTMDVIIPTLGRKTYLLQVLKDLSQQTLLPKKVIIVEQNSDVNAVSEIQEYLRRKWPFEVILEFTHQVGVCHARNLALDKTTEEWVFLSDDDQRLKPDLFEKAFEKIEEYGIHAVVTNYLQPEEHSIFNTTKQWGSFGAGNSMVKKVFLEKVSFSRIFEHGYGEDIDFGMQLRNVGCDIIYHPDLEILHLKAPVGGFRKEDLREWEKEVPLPKPSPTVMLFAQKYYTREQLRGYKAELFLRFYAKQPVKNPFTYYKLMKTRWKRSESWAIKLKELGV